MEIFTPLVIRREKSEREGKQGNYRWHKTNRDCAGLVRYVFAEAMSPHDGHFLGYYPELNALPDSPDTGELRRARVQWQQGNNTARELIQHSIILGRTVQTGALKTGDLLYFESAELKIRHVMLVIRSPRGVFLVYHTGDERDELRIRTLADILSLPETQWHPEPGNPVFRGYFRPAFLD